MHVTVFNQTNRSSVGSSDGADPAASGDNSRVLEATMSAVRISLVGPLLACIDGGTLAFAPEQNNNSSTERDVGKRAVEDGFFLHNDAALLKRINKTKGRRKRFGKT